MIAVPRQRVLRRDVSACTGSAEETAESRAFVMSRVVRRRSTSVSVVGWAVTVILGVLCEQEVSNSDTIRFLEILQWDPRKASHSLVTLLMRRANLEGIRNSTTNSRRSP